MSVQAIERIFCFKKWIEFYQFKKIIVKTLRCNKKTLFLSILNNEKA